MVGSDSRPMVTTVAPTMPVEAASRAPTMLTEMPRPPRKVPNSRPMLSSSSSATLERSSITPMKTKSGTAISTSLVMVPKTRWGRKAMKSMSKMPSEMPMIAKARATPARVKATGKPASSTRHTVANIRRSRISTSSMAQASGWCGGGATGGSPRSTKRDFSAIDRPCRKIRAMKIRITVFSRKTAGRPLVSRDPSSTAQEAAT